MMTAELIAQLDGRSWELVTVNCTVDPEQPHVLRFAVA